MKDADWISAFKNHFTLSDDGQLFWKTNKSQMKAGSLAGSFAGDGRYRRVKINGRVFYVHRVIFAMANGYFPEEVDHIDGDTLNNRPENLRPATRSQNAMNRKKQSNCTSGHTGIQFVESAGKWRAHIKVKQKSIWLGYHDTLKSAISARKSAELKYHGEYRSNRDG